MADLAVPLHLAKINFAVVPLEEFAFSSWARREDKNNANMLLTQPSLIHIIHRLYLPKNYLQSTHGTDIVKKLCDRNNT
jgi:hypothetical protein